MSIRLLGPEDRGAIIEIYDELKHEYAFPLGAEWTEEKLRKEMVAAKGYGFFEPKAHMQAFLLYRVTPDVREITLLATRKSAQKNGVMGRLLGHFLQNAGAKVWLEVHAANVPAKSLYLRAGFREQGLRKAYYRDGGDALLLEYNPLQ